jgi:hypothetical protein
MNDPSDFSLKHMEEVQLVTILAQPEKRGIISRTIGAWLRLTGASYEQTGTSIEEQEYVRHSRLLSAILFCSGLTILFLIPTAIPVPTYWISIILNLFFTIVALALNRAGKVTIAGIFFVLAIDATLIIGQAILPTGIRNSNIPDFDLFILPILISGIILPKRFIPFIALLHIVIIIALFSLLPHDTLLTQEIRINQGGFAYSELSDALIIQVIGAALAWLGAWSVDKALLRASRAEDLAKARQRLQKQSLQLIEQKQRLDYGIDVVKSAQARFANGDYKARAKLQDNELAPLAISFNLLAERMNRITQVAQDYTRLEEAIKQLLELQQTIIYGGTLKVYKPTGTIVDRIEPIIQRYHQLSSLLTQNRSSLEMLWKGFTHEQTLVAELHSILSQLSSATRTFSRNNDANKPQFSDSPLRASQEMSSAKLSTYLDTQIQLLKKAQQICDQIELQKNQSLQETKRLTALLPNNTNKSE